MKKILLMSFCLLISSVPSIRFSYATVALDVVDDATDQNYCVYMMWINKDKSETQRYIHPSANEEDLKRNLLNKAYEWSRINHGCEVCILYDSQLIPRRAVSNTMEVIDTMSDCNIKLKNVRNYSLVKRYHYAFRQELPVYFRVDLLRLIAADDLLRKKIDQDFCFVYADVDMEPVGCSTIIQRQKRDLMIFGVIMSEGHQHEEGYISYFENGFQITYAHKEFLDSVKSVIISPALMRGCYAFSLYEREKFGRMNAYRRIKNWQAVIRWEEIQVANRTKMRTDEWFTFLEESVYNSYHGLFFYFYGMTGKGRCDVKFTGFDGKIRRSNLREDISIPISFEGGHRNTFSGHYSLCDILLNPSSEIRMVHTNPRYLLEREVNRDGDTEPTYYIPRCKVNLPPSRFTKRVD